MEFPVTLRTACSLAMELEELLAESCARFEIAGSIRRYWSEHTTAGKNQRIMGDVELVCLPKNVADPKALFAETSALDLRMSQLHKDGMLSADVDHACNGPRYKRVIYRRQTKVDIFIVLPPASWGAMLAIRTGDADFARLLVTPREKGGAMPPGLRCKHGGLCDIAKHVGDEKTPCTSTCRIPTENETEFFAALELPFVAVDRRTEKDFRSLISRRNHAGTVS